MSGARINTQEACLAITKSLVRSRPPTVTADYALEALTVGGDVAGLTGKYGPEYVAGWRDGWEHQKATQPDAGERYREGVDDGKAAVVMCRQFWNQL